ncbi:MAG TPA: DUF6624 domain-containing protein [Chitinophagaceae bacterium]|nr:DUF6624 domain-containing protein [Chitinophagaceae bacterium]
MMLKKYLFYVWFLIPQLLIGQDSPVPEKYFQNTYMADIFLSKNNYDSALFYYKRAFESFNGRGGNEDLYKVSRIWGLKKNRDSCLKYLTNAVENFYYNYIKLQNDSAFNLIHNGPQFNRIISMAKHNKENFYPNLNLQWSNLLEEVFIEDQKRAYFNFENPKDVALLNEIDSRNTRVVASFIDQHGWLGSDVIGDLGNDALFLVIQHASHDIRKKYFPILKQAVSEKKASPQQLALMEDRLLVEDHGYQLYGSQLELDTISKKYKLLPIKDEEHVNERRKEMGMGPLEDYLKIYNIEYLPPKKKN